MASGNIWTGRSDIIGFTPHSGGSGLETPDRPAADVVAGKRIAVGAGVLLSLSTVALVEALQIGPLAPVGVVSATYPVTTTVLALVVLHEHLRPRHVVGIAAALVGCALLGLR